MQASTGDAVVRTNIFTGRHKGTKKDTLKIFKILFVISVASCETGLFTRSSQIDAFPFVRYDPNASAYICFSKGVPAILPYFTNRTFSRDSTFFLQPWPASAMDRPEPGELETMESIANAAN